MFAFVFASLAVWHATLQGSAQSRSPSELDALESQLAQETSLASVERIALARHPTLSEAKARAAALDERASGAHACPILSSSMSSGRCR
jgi:hypothetical protein